MTTNLIWILYRSDSDTAYKETLNCKKIIEGYGKKVLFSEISNETNNINQLFLKSEVLPEITKFHKWNITTQILDYYRHINAEFLNNVVKIFVEVYGTENFVSSEKQISY